MHDELHNLNYRYGQLRRQMHCLTVCPDGDVPKSFTQLLGFLEQLFADENRLMEAHQFPARRCHLEQHARALSGLHRAHSRVMGGACHQGRYAATHLLMHWFELHNSTLDACLAVWLEATQNYQERRVDGRRGSGRHGERRGQQ